MRNPRKIILIAGLIIFVIGCWLAWQALHPTLSPAEQIKANLESMRSGVQTRSVRNVARFLAKDFTWRGTPRDEITKHILPGAFFMSRDIDLRITNLETEVQGDTATSTGHYVITYRPQADAPNETRRGSFKMEWRLDDGVWKVVKGEGGENIGP